MFERIKRFYDRKLWTQKQVHDVVAVRAITAEEYELITGEVYDANNPPVNPTN